MIRCGWAAAVMFAGACNGGKSPGDSGTTPTGCTAEDIEVTPGVGADGYAPLSPGDPVTLVHGPQGGWHIETAGLVVHSESEVSVQPRIIAPDLGELQLVGDQEAAFLALVGYDDATCEGTFYNARGFVNTAQGALSDQDFVCTLRDQPLRFELTVSDIVSGRTGTASVDVVAALDANDVPVCDNPSVALGTGAGDAFVPFAAGDPIRLINDGGVWHVEVSGRVRRSGPDVTVHPRVVVVEPGSDYENVQIVGADAPVAVALADHDPGFAGGEGTFAGVAGAVDVDHDPLTGQDFVCWLAGKRLRLEVAVDAGADGAHTASVEGVGTLDPVDVTACGG